MIPLSWQIGGLAVAIALAFSSGWKVHAWKVDAEVVEAMEAHVKQWRAAQDATDDLSNRLEKASQERKVITNTITKEVIRYAESKNLDHCVLPAEFGVLFDSAATGTATPSGETSATTGGAKDTTDSSIIETTVQNFERCREWRASLIGWQEWYQSVVTAVSASSTEE